MIKNFFSVLIFLLIFLFIFFIFSTYFSEENQKKINLNRKNIYSIIENNLTTLPLLKNDTQDVIEFNTGFENDNKKIKRNFWNLFKKND
jgi:predicted PurR-regulated permease PerM